MPGTAKRLHFLVLLCEWHGMQSRQSSQEPPGIPIVCQVGMAVPLRWTQMSLAKVRSNTLILESERMRT
eukprot:CCRYP_016450-RA/>CCRYP_016450-RA protein AED:0.22 eAED:0.73 QI:0/0/0/1/0/0/2/0/68